MSQTQSTAAHGDVRLTLARISFIVVAIAAFISLVALIDAMLPTDFAVFETLNGFGAAGLMAVLSVIALIGLGGVLTAEPGGATATRDDSGRLGLHLKLTEPRLSGPDVEYVQAMLHVLQYPIHIDGVYGTASDAAIRHFQESVGLPVDGVVERTTVSALQSQVGALGRMQWVRQILEQIDDVPQNRQPLQLVAEAGAD